MKMNGVFLEEEVDPLEDDGFDDFQIRHRLNQDGEAAPWREMSYHRYSHSAWDRTFDEYSDGDWA